MVITLALATISFLHSNQVDVKDLALQTKDVEVYLLTTHRWHQAPDGTWQHRLHGKHWTLDEATDIQINGGMSRHSRPCTNVVGSK